MIVSPVIRAAYPGPGAGPFAFPFLIFAGTDLEVTQYVAATQQNLSLVWGVDFIVNAGGIANRTGGSVALTTALAAGDTITLRRNPGLGQDLQIRDIRNQGVQYPATIEDAMDYLTMITQRIDDDLGRSLKLPVTSDPTLISMVLPTPSAGKALIWNIAGTGLDNGTLSAAQLSAWQAANQMFNDVYTSALGQFTPGVTTQLVLSQATPGSPNNLSITYDLAGVVTPLQSDDFSLAGNVVTFAVAIPGTCTRVEIKYLQTYQVNTINATNATYNQGGVGAVTRTVQNRLAEMLFATDFGVKGDGVTDDTVAFQAALTAGATYNRMVYCGNLVIKITGALIMAGPGIWFDRVSYGNASDPGIYVTGAGYVALTCSTAAIADMRLALYGTGNACDGIVFTNPVKSFISNIRVYDLAGAGVTINEVFDSLFLDISVELCGTTTKYAFSVNDGGGTSNMSHFVRLQVEQAQYQAIFISPNTLCCVFDAIHSERATVSALYITWQIGGADCTYNSMRIEASGTPANAQLFINATGGTLTSLRSEGAIPVVVNVGAGTYFSLITPNIAGALSMYNNQYGLLEVFGGQIATVASAFANNAAGPIVLHCTGTKITSLAIGDCANPGNPRLAQFTRCIITALTSTSTNSAATFDNCWIAEGNSLCQSHTVLRGTTVTCAGAIALASGILEAFDSVINAAITYTNNTPLRGYGTTFNGAITRGDAGTTDLLFDDGCRFPGGGSNLGPPSGGQHYVGDYCKNALPAEVGAGGSKYVVEGWICTAGGTPGTFLQKRTLTGN